MASERSLAAPVLEVFPSIQGEGLFVGEPQVLLRLAGCPLRCRWCDTPGSWSLAGRPEDGAAGGPTARIHGVAGVRREGAWATPFHAATWVVEVEPGRPRTVSVTGGEPLVWPEFVRRLRTFLGPRRIHLETGGGHPLALERVVDAVDHVSLDLKVGADLDPPVPIEGAHERSPASELEWAAARSRCLRLVRDRDACAKLVVSGERRVADFEPVLDDVASSAPELPLVLQPVTPLNGVPAPGRALVDALVELALERSLDVRVLPQVHRALGMP